MRMYVIISNGNRKKERGAFKVYANTESLFTPKNNPTLIDL